MVDEPADLSPGAEPLHVGTQDRFGVTFWAEVNPLSLNVPWEFRVYPTGHQIDDNEAAARKKVEKISSDIEDLYNNAPCGYHSLDIKGVFSAINQTELS